MSANRWQGPPDRGLLISTQSGLNCPQSSENKKYSDVKSVVHTGKTIKDDQLMSDQFVAKKRGELFKRIKGSTIAKLIDETKNSESIYNLAEEPEKALENNLMNNINNNNQNNYNNKQNQSQNDNVSVYSSHTTKTDRTGMTQLTSQTGFTAVTYATQMLGNLSDISFVLLDLRDKDDFDRAHIKEAKSFPGQNISRDKFPLEVVNLKNKDSKLIVIYHVDERNSTPYAQLLSQKGFENVFLLSGGIEDFVNKFPEKCEGTEVQKYINMIKQNQLLKKDAPLKNTSKNNFKISIKENRSNSQESKKTTTTRKPKVDKYDYKITGKITDKI